ncbi:WD40 repeat-like protein [Hymenopellis radicata]|nr:WD40 repeat-like protein [Hymenopellis radicata]
MPKHAGDKQPCGCKKGRRNLVVCIDGTSNQVGIHNTNVADFYSLIKKGDGSNQRTWYSSGIGTFASSSWKSLAYLLRTIWHKIDMAIAWNVDDIVCAAYRWLSDNYKPGDCIYLLGFSRGAYQVRVLSAMIDKVGLLHKGNETQIPFAYERYSRASDLALGYNYKQTLSQNVTVHFVGAWDTVSSVGMSRASALLPGTIDGMMHVCYFRHALALDERRAKFLPEYAYGGSMRPEHTESGTSKVKEVWFAGTHSDIGGGNVRNLDMGRRLPPLRWMVSEAKKAGLRMDEMRNEFLSLNTVDIKESLTGLWWPLEVFPVKRLAYTDRFSTTHRPHLGQGRTICNGQKIDLSVCLTKDNWVPKARPSASMAGTDTHFDPTKLRHDIDGIISGPRDKYPPFLEVDQYERVRIMLLKRIKRTGDSGLTNQMRSESQSDPQWQEDLLSALIELLLEPGSSEHLGSEILDTFNTELSPLRIRRRQINLFTASPLITKLLSGGNEKDKETAGQFLLFSKDGKYIFHGGSNKHLHILDAYTGEAVAQVPTMGKEVSSSAFSSNGGRCVVGGQQGDGGGFVQVFNWSEEQRQLSEAGSELFKDVICGDSVGFLPNQDPNQEEDVVVLQEGKILVWNGKDPVKLMEGDTSQVDHIAFSPRGDTMAAYSRSSRELAVWNAATRKCLFTLPARLDDWVSCIACSTNGELLTSGSWGGLIRIWDTKSGEESGQLRGHADGVFSVCFSPDSKLLVSGSADKTIKVWDVTTCKLLETLLEGSVGEKYAGLSVAFSPDGKRIVSGGLDGTVRVWDIENIASSRYGRVDE